MFRKADLDMDGFVSGQEIRDIFLQSGLQNNVLAHIWYVQGSRSIKNILDRIKWATYWENLFLRTSKVQISLYICAV